LQHDEQDSNLHKRSERAGDGASPDGSGADENHLGMDAAKIVVAYGSARYRADEWRNF